MKKKLRFVLTAALAVLLVVSVGMLLRQRRDDQERAASYEEAARYAKITLPDLSPAPAPEPSETGDGEAADPVAEELANIDLAALQAVNPEVLGWVCIPGTELSYPLLRGEDNQFYLKHTWDGTPNSGGSIFMDYRCAPDFTGFNTVLYGHRMQNRSMFAPLKDYKDPEFWREHPSVYVADSSGVHVYDIFAAWEPSVTSVVYTMDIDTEEERQELLDACLEGSELDTGLVPDQEDSILTLSTCTGRGHATRWVVQAYLAREYVE